MERNDEKDGAKNRVYKDQPLLTSIEEVVSDKDFQDLSVDGSEKDISSYDVPLHTYSPQSASYHELELDNYYNQLDEVETAPLCTDGEVEDGFNFKDPVHILEDQKSKLAEFSEYDNTNNAVRKRSAFCAFSTKREEPYLEGEPLKRSKSLPSNGTSSTVIQDTDGGASVFDPKVQTKACEEVNVNSSQRSQDNINTSFGQSGLLDLTLKTAELLRVQEDLNKDISNLKVMAQQHIRQVLGNPENAQLRERLLTLRKDFISRAPERK